MPNPNEAISMGSQLVAMTPCDKELRELVAKWKETSDRCFQRYSNTKRGVNRRDYGLSEAYVKCADELDQALTTLEQPGLQDLAAELYQVCGALNAPAKVLDQLAAAASGEPLPYETLLPSIANDFTDLEMKAGDCGGAKRQIVDRK